MNIDTYTGDWPDRKLRRDALRALGRCINGPMSLVVINAHGPVVAGGRCQKCLDVKRRSH